MRIVSRLGIFAVTLFGASLLIFTITNALPGDVAQIILGTDATNEAVASLREQLGLNRHLIFRYFEWLGGILHGDFGVSLLSGDQVSVLLAPRIAVTFWLVGLGILLSLLIALPLGMIAALKRHRASGVAISAGAQVGMAIPAFWMGILLVLIFAVYLRWLPANGYVSLSESPGAWAAHLVLPVLTLAMIQSAVLLRYVRSACIEVLGEDYYRTARAIGWTPFRALLRHGLRNIAISLVTVVAIQLSTALVGAIVIEQVFTLPGLGSLLLNAVAQRDLVVVQGVVMFLVLVVLVINALVDIGYVIIDPKQRRVSAG